jgi:PAS domain S-box-containing protein
MNKKSKGSVVQGPLPPEQEHDVADLIVTLLHQVFVKDAHLKFLFVNEGFARHLGVDPAQAVGCDDFAFFEAARARMFQEADRVAMAAPGPTTQDSVFVDDTGETIVYTITKCPIRDETGKVVALVGVADQSTYRERAEETFSHWASVVMSSGDAIMALSPDGTIRAWSPGARSMYGYALSEVVGRPVTMLVGASEREQMHAVIQRVAAGQAVKSYQARHITKRGRGLWVDLTLSPVLSRAHEVTAISVVGHDVSDRVRMERQLKESLERLARSSTELGFLAHAVGRERQRPSHHQDAIEEIATAIRTDPTRTVHFEAEARRLNVSYSHFRRLFRQFTGHAPHDYALLWRMRRAASLLQDPSRPVKAVALEVGYDDPAQFSKTFKKKIGMSPSDFRAYGAPA